jgi:hypothetical protein
MKIHYGINYKYNNNMGFVFKQEPTEQERFVMRLQEENKAQADEIAKLNEFLELVGRGHLYDLWKDGLYDPKVDTTVDQYIEFEDLSSNEEGK